MILYNTTVFIFFKVHHGSWYRKQMLPTIPSLIKICDAFGNKISSNEKNLKQYVSGSYLEATIGFEPMIRVLQTRALPLGYVAFCCLHLQKLF